MAIVTDTAYHFYFGTLAQYNALKTGAGVNANDLYFITDTKQIYVGEDLYTGEVQAVTAFPTSPAAGIIYVNTTTKEVKTYDGSAWTQIVAPTSTTLTASTADTDLVTAKAIRDYVNGITDNGVTDITYNASTQKFTVDYAGKDSKELALKNLFNNATYDGSTGKLTFVKINKAEGEEDLVLNLPVENFLANASYDEKTHILTLTMESGDKFDVNLEDLVDTYTVSDTTSVDLTMTGNNITADVKVSGKTGNALSVQTAEGEQGLYVAEDYIQSIDDTNSVDLTVSDHKLTADVKVSTVDNNSLVIKTDEGKEGLFVDISGKQDNLTEVQLAAVNSGITATKVAKYDGYEATIAEKVVKNDDITAATHTKITYDAKGLVTAGEDLAEDDIPALHLTKITDVTATVTEVNYLSGAKSNIQAQIDLKADASNVYTKAEINDLAQWKAIGAPST